MNKGAAPKLPPQVLFVLGRLWEKGYEAYAVGGCVRSFLLGDEPHDYDVATSAKPQEIKEAFPDVKTVDTGIKYGTVTVICGGVTTEVTTYRVDGAYLDNRRPDNVEFTTLLAEDLKRRDFTVNAMAYSPRAGIIDIFGGQRDIEEGVIRCVGDPDERFREDGLRIMRALRFAAQCSFKIEEQTSRSIHENRALLKNIAGERIAAELNRLICGDCAHILREYSDVLSVFLPELGRLKGFEQHTKYHDRDILEHTIAATAAIEPEKGLRLTMLLHDIGKPDCFTRADDGTGHFKGHPKVSAEIAERFFERLKYDGETRARVTALIKTHDIPIENREPLIKRYLNKYGEEMFLDMIKVHIADDAGKAPEYRTRRAEGYRACALTAKRIIAERACFSLKDLAVNGRDIMAAGYKGPGVGEKLDYLLGLVIDGECENEREKLLDRI